MSTYQKKRLDAAEEASHAIDLLSEDDRQLLVYPGHRVLEVFPGRKLETRSSADRYNVTSLLGNRYMGVIFLSLTTLLPGGRHASAGQKNKDKIVETNVDGRLPQ